MKFECPACHAHYNLPLLQAEGPHKRMKCAKCAHVFVPQTAEGPAPAATPDLMPEPDVSMVAESLSDLEIVDADDLQWEEETSEAAFMAALNAEDAFERPDQDTSMVQSKPSYREFLARRMERGRPIIRRLLALSHQRRSGVVAALLSPIVILAGLLVAPQSVARTFPELASLYEMTGMTVNLRGLEIADAFATERVDNGVEVLVVNGTVRNLKDREIDLPPLQMVFQARQRMIYAWQHDWESTRIAANGSKPFQVLLSAPPEVAEELQLRFLR